MSSGSESDLANKETGEFKTGALTPGQAKTLHNGNNEEATTTSIATDAVSTPNGLSTVKEHTRRGSQIESC